MYKHILVPTDGSALSDKAAEAAIKLAQLLGARITAFHAMEPYPLQGAYAAEASGVPELQPEIFAERSEEYAKRVLETFKAAAGAAHVECTTCYATARSPSQAIVEKARAEKCDLIVMASHGRRGL
jgi:nucleotide-binding universal stress UspA family protein